MAFPEFRSRSLAVIRLALAASCSGLVVFQIGCGPAKSVSRKEKMVPTAATSEVQAIGPVIANGVDVLTVTVFVRDQAGSPMAGIIPVLSVSGTDNTVSACLPTTDAGAATCTVTSTKAEEKSINVTTPMILAGVSVAFEPGPATKLAFHRQPLDSTESQLLVSQPIVEIRDAFDNRVAAGTHNVALTLQSPATGTLGGTTTVATQSGLATFNNVSVSLEGTKVLTATASGLTSATSAPFEVYDASGKVLVFQTHPGGGAAGAAWAIQPVVHILMAPASAVDTAAQVPVTLTLTSGTGAILGTMTVNAVNGVAVFAGLKTEVVGAKVLTASSPGVANAVSNSFTVVPAAPSTLSFSVQPGGGTVGLAWVAQPAVRLVDAYGNLCTNTSASVSLNLQAGTGPLIGTSTLAAVSGVATFAGLRMNVAGEKLLRATAGSLSVDSNPFLVLPGAAAVLKFSAEPVSETAGQAWAVHPAVEARDSFNNRATSFVGSVALTLTGGTGVITGGPLTSTAVSGVATFPGLKMTKVGADKVLTASSAGLTAGTTSSFEVKHAAIYEMALTAAPSADLANTVLTTQPKIEFRDQFGNIVTTGPESSAPVGVSLQTGSGALTGPTGTVAISGVATFVGLKFNTPGIKVLRFTKPNLVAFGGTNSLYVDSASVEARIGPAAKLNFHAQTSGGTAGVVWSQQPAVEITDTAGNRVPTATGTIGLSLDAGSGSLLGSTTATASAGLATFSGLKMNTSGAKVLRAQSSGLTGATSTSFGVVHSVATQVALVTAPTGNVYSSNLTPQPVVAVQDAFGNTVTSGADAAANISAAILSGSGPLSGTANLTAVSGVATFTNLGIATIGAKVLRFTKSDTTAGDGTVTNFVDSSTFTIYPGGAAKLALLAAPTGAIAGLALPVQPVIEVQDAGGNRVTTSNASITVSTAQGLLGTRTVTAVSGVATYSNLYYNTTGAKTPTFTSTGLTQVVTPSFTVAPTVAAALVLATAPTGAAVNANLAAQPVVHIRDLHNNTVATGVDSTANVTVTLLSGTGTLLGTVTRPAVAGVVTFTGLKIDTIGVKTLRFTKADLTGTGGAASLVADSSSFTITPGAGASLVYTTPPGGGTAGTAMSQQPVLQILDAQGNLATAATTAVSLTLTTGSGTLSGATTVNAVGGVVTFSDISVEAIGANKILTASGLGLTPVASSSFAITAGVASTNSDIAATPLSLWADGTSVSTVVVGIVDAYGNPAAGRTVALTSSRGSSDTITGNPGTTDVNGEVSFTIKSATAGQSELTATVSEGNVVLATKPTITFEDAVVSVAQSTWSQDRIGAAADGATLITVTGTLRNVAGTGLPNTAVTLSSSRGGSDAITPASGVSDSSGNFSFTVKSIIPGTAKLTLSAPTVPVVITDLAQAQFIAATPYSEWIASLASDNVNTLLAGSNSPAVTNWLDVANGGTADGSLTNFSYNSAASGWMGDGGTTISGGASGPYRLGFDGANDFVDAGTSFNNLTAMTFDVWARPANMSAGGSVLMSNADVNNGLVIKVAEDKSRRWQASIGAAATYADEVLADSPVAYWRLAEASGTAISSAAGTMATAALAGGVTVGQEGALTSNNTSVLFDGASGQINFGDAYHNDGGSVTLEAWIRLDSPVSGANRTIIGKQTSSVGFALEVNSSQKAVFRGFAYSSPVTAVSDTALSTGAWYHLVGVRSSTERCNGSLGKSVSVYVNGAFEACENLGGTTSGTSGTSLYIGYNSSSPSYFAGHIDEVAVYDGELSATRIAAHAAARSVPTCESGAITNNAWSHVLFGFDEAAQTMRLQVNGIETCQLSGLSSSVNGSTARMSFGGRLTSGGALVGGTAWQGAIGQVRIYNRAINASQATTTYNSQSPLY